MKHFFDVSVTKYSSQKNYSVYRPSSLNNPKDNSVMFVTEGYIQYAEVLSRCSNCLVYWPYKIEIPNEIVNKHVFVLCENPHNSYCTFFIENNITNLPPIEMVKNVNGAFISPNARIGENCKIFPGCYIGGEVVIGNGTYIGTGTKLLGRVTIGNNVIIRENTVIGADGLTTDRGSDGRATTMPQFGGVVIEDDVIIGALTSICRGAIDDTIIQRGAKISNHVSISHNVNIGPDTFIVGETILFGSASTGSKAWISGNVTIREGRHIGDKAKIGMGSVVTKDVEDNSIVKGNPAKPI